MRALDAHDRILLQLLRERGPQPCVTHADYDALAKALRKGRSLTLGAVCSIVAHGLALVREGTLTLVEPKPSTLR